jgi:hypothetical protein
VELLEGIIKCVDYYMAEWVRSSMCWILNGRVSEVIGLGDTVHDDDDDDDDEDVDEGHSLLSRLCQKHPQVPSLHCHPVGHKHNDIIIALLTAYNSICNHINCCQTYICYYCLKQILLLSTGPFHSLLLLWIILCYISLTWLFLCCSRAGTTYSVSLRSGDAWGPSLSGHTLQTGGSLGTRCATWSDRSLENRMDTDAVNSCRDTVGKVTECRRVCCCLLVSLYAQRYLSLRHELNRWNITEQCSPHNEEIDTGTWFIMRK